jgi:predicted small secreted protein
MEKKLLAIIVLVIVASMSIAGCTSSTSSNQGAGSASQAASTKANTTTSTSATASATPAAVPTTPTTGSTFNVVIMGPTTIRLGGEGAWNVIVVKNGVALTNPTGQIRWSIDGVTKAGTEVYFVTHAIDSGTTWAPAGQHTLTATYTGDPSMPSGSMTVTSMGPSATPTATPSGPVTGSFGQSSYVVANGTVVTATVSNWQSNPDVEIGNTAHAQTVPMQSIGNGEYTYTFEGVIFYTYGSGTGGITLVDNGAVVASATTTWSNPAPAGTA